MDDFSRACKAFIDSSHSSGLYNLGGGRDNATSLTKLLETIGRLIEIDPIIDNNVTLPHPVPVNYVTIWHGFGKNWGGGPRSELRQDYGVCCKALGRASCPLRFAKPLNHSEHRLCVFADYYDGP